MKWGCRFVGWHMIDNRNAVLKHQERTESRLELRKEYCDTLIAEAEKNPAIIAIEVDVMGSMGTTAFAERFPEKSVNCGIQEANAVGVAAALAIEGYIPFFHAFGPFATRRVFDQVYLSCGYQQAAVKIVGGDAGISAAANGGTHMPLEDISLMRAIPNMTILEPADGVAMRQTVPAMAKWNGSVYCRSSRKKVTDVYRPEARFRIGEASLVRDGHDVVIFSAGILVAEALDAAELLQSHGIDAAVVDLYCIQPADKACILEYAEKCRAVVTAENQNVCGGLGSLVAEILGEACPVPMERIGVRESFGEVGTVEWLKVRFGLKAENIVQACERVLNRKID